MSGGMNRLRVEVDDLRHGMYVVEPDRPWVELPFALQGFIIETEEELKVLREYCRYVYVDPVRSTDADGEQDLESTGRSAGGRAGRSGGDEPDDGIDQSRRDVDVDKLRPQLESASRAISSARGVLDEAFSDVFKGKGVDLDATGAATGELIEQLTKNPTASLLLTSLDSRDHLTTLHSVHVCLLVVAFCLRAKLDPRKVETLALGALLHDIGKANLPSELIHRAGPLTEYEWELVRRHPIDGRQILADSGRFPRPVLNIALMHHERRDGKGYPKGLTREQLPDYVLIAALANRYQSLTSPRPYREAAAPDKVLRSFYAEAGNLFGTRFVEAFIRCVGIYPMGSVVELDNGALAVVVGSRPNSRLRPTVQLVKTPDGEPYDKLVLINLAAEAERREKKAQGLLARSVRRVRSPSETGINPGEVIARSFGLKIT